MSEGGGKLEDNFLHCALISSSSPPRDNQIIDMLRRRESIV